MKYSFAAATGLALLASNTVEVDAQFGSIPDSIKTYANRFLAPIIRSNKRYLEKTCSSDDGSSDRFLSFSANDECNPVVQQLIEGNGLAKFSSKARVNNGAGLPDAMYPKFIDMMNEDFLGQLDSSSRREWSKISKKILKANKNPVTFRTMGCDRKGKCNFLTLVGKHDKKAEKTDISIVSVDMKFEFAPDIFVVRQTVTDPETGKSQTEDVIEERRSTKKTDVDQMMKFMEIVAFEKLTDGFDDILLTSSADYEEPSFDLFNLVDEEEIDGEEYMNHTMFMDKWGSYIQEVNIPEEGDPDAEMKLQAQFLPALGGLAGAVNSVTSAWSGIVSAFGSSYSKELTDMRLNRGFDKFRSSMKTFVGEGLPHARSKEFMKDLSKKLSIPSAYKKDFEFIAKWVQFFDQQTWTQSDINFSKGKGGTTSNFNFFAKNRDKDQKLDVTYVTCSNEFKLAPDIYVWTTRRSKMGGLFSSTKTEIQKKPAAITETQLKFVSEWFLLLAYQELARFMKIAVPGKGKNPVPV